MVARVVPASTADRRCFDRKGKPKVHYATRHDARIGRELFRRRMGERIAIYPCPERAGFHLGHGHAARSGGHK